MNKQTKTDRLMLVLKKYIKGADKALIDPETQDSFFKDVQEAIIPKSDYKKSFNQSSLVEEYIKEQPLDSEFTPDYEGLNYIRYMKVFNPEKRKLDIPKFDKKFQPTIDIEAKMNEPFHLRYYFPKSMITRNESYSYEKNRIVIMINGLNEWESFGLYDILGEHFAKNDIAAVLVPTPLHLNRRISSKYKKLDGKSIRPTDIAAEHPIIFYKSFLKSFNEINELVCKINPPKNLKNRAEFFDKWSKDEENYNKRNQDDIAFYKKHFWKNEENPRETDIILLGYSLGGLRALSFFLQSNNKFRCCITVNSGANLFDVHPETLKIPEDFWEKMLLESQEAVDNLILNENYEEPTIYDKYNFDTDDNPSNHKEYNSQIRLRALRNIFQTMYFGERKAIVKKLFREESNILKRYLAITSGGDKIVEIDQMKHITSRRKHINQLIVAGVDHILTEDENWYEVLPRVENNIVNFINSCIESHYKKIELAKSICTILEDLESFKINYINYIFKKDKIDNDYSEEQFQELLFDIEKANPETHPGKVNKKVVEFYDLYFSSKGHYFNFSELYNSIMEYLRNGIIRSKSLSKLVAEEREKRLKIQRGEELKEDKLKEEILASDKEAKVIKNKKIVSKKKLK